MKSGIKHTKKIIAALAALMIIFIALICLFSSGCNYVVNYEYKVEYEGGEGYYVVKASGYTNRLKGELEIPSYYGEGDKYAPVREIADEAFRGAEITKLVIPATITKIGAAAFANCSHLKEVVFEEGISIDEIPQGMFGFDRSLTSITIPDTVETIGYRAFYDCERLATVNLSQNLKTITMSAFENCYVLSGISFPEGLESIGALAFYFSGLTEVVIPDSVHDTQITVTDEDGTPQSQTLYGLGYGAFHTCRSLKKAVVGSGITQIKSGVFGYCDKLEEIYIPASVTKIEGSYKNGETFISGHAFHNCNSLKIINYAGTPSQWAQIDIEKDGYSNNGAIYNNNALFEDKNDKLTINYNKSYTPSV